MEQDLREPLSLKSHIFMCVIPVKNIDFIFSNDLYIFWLRQFIFGWKKKNIQKSIHIYSSEIIYG